MQTLGTLSSVAINCKNVQALEDQIITNAPYLSSTFFYFCLISLCRWPVSSPNKTYPVARLSPESSPGQTDGKSARSPAVRQETGLLLDQTKKKKKWVIIPLIAETVWRRPDQFSRGKRYFSLMRISYEDTEEKQRWFQGGTVTFHMQNPTRETNICK